MSALKQFQFCPLCRCSHNDGNKHIYTKRHRNLITSLLKRFSSKIKVNKNVIEHPIIKSLIQNEHQEKFWCYFCESEFDRHVINEYWVILEQEFINHLSSLIHEKNTRTFFKKNCLKRDLKEFLISKEDFKRHLTNSQVALEKCRNEEQQKILKEMKKIDESERKKESLSNFLKNNQSPPVNNYSLPKCDTKVKGKKTIAVFSSGLTCINIKSNGDDRTGNVFSDSLPPWLQNAEPFKTDTIGPTLGDYENHLKQQKLLKLPPERVGANLDNKFPINEQWLPSFGQVWNNKRRLQSKQNFLKQMKRSSTITSNSKSIETVKPYKRKKLNK